MDLITVTLNQERSGAILHINCQSDGNVEMSPTNQEEGNTDAQKLWLGKLGCMLKIHQGIECQWPHSLKEANTNMSFLDEFNDPWMYALSNFPEGYKFYGEERQAQGENPPRKDYYLCGMSLPPLYLQPH